MESICAAMMDLSDHKIVDGGNVAAIGVFEPEGAFLGVNLKGSRGGGEQG